jgi:GNAT superfamily N-acetyltransferase
MQSLEHGGLMAEIDGFFVIPAQRSAGVGSLLLAAAQHDLQAAGTRRASYELYEKPL